MHFKAHLRVALGSLALALSLSFPVSAAVVNRMSVDFTDKYVSGTPGIVAAPGGPHLELMLNSDGSITAELTTSAFRINMVGFDAAQGTSVHQQSLPTGSAGKITHTADGDFELGWGSRATVALNSMTWTLTKVGGYSSILNLLDGTGSPNYDFFVHTATQNNTFTQWFANAGPIVSAVPVPGAAGLMLSGLAVLPLMRRRKR